MTVNKLDLPSSENAVQNKINEIIDNLGGGGVAPVWGNITGTLSNQTDLQNVLNNKYDASNPSGYTSNVGTVTSVNNVAPVNGNVTLTIPDTSTLANYNLSNLTSTGKTKLITIAYELDFDNSISVSTTSSGDATSYTATADGIFTVSSYTRGGTSMKYAIARCSYTDVDTITNTSGSYVSSTHTLVTAAGWVPLITGQTIYYMIYSSGGSLSNVCSATFIPYKKA